jgi:pyruvate dehydrogenase E2 component (dihydrolipoamide acetyltransferase)
MAIPILMPALSPTMTEGNLVKWHKNEGDKVKPGDVIAEIETDKATMEVEVVDGGTLGKILIPAGTENVKVNAPIAILLEAGEDKSALDTVKLPGAAVPAAAAPQAVTAPAPEAHHAPALAAPVTHAPATSGRVAASPLARRIAASKGVDIGSVSGSGPRGRVIKRDVESATPGTTTGVTSPARNLSGPAFEDVSISNMRKVIAKRLVESKQTVPHFYLTIDCRVDEILRIRQTLNKYIEPEKLTVNDFVIKAVAMALRDHPDANASWMGDKIRRYRNADISIAVAIPDGLITPIVKAADLKSLRDISREMKDLAKRAKDGKLKPEEFQGGSFSISNLGMYGIREFGAIINPPQSCILAVGTSEERAIVEDGQVHVRSMMSCTLSVDHRVVDGKLGAEFLVTFKKYMENPLLMMMV